MKTFPLYRKTRQDNMTIWEYMTLSDRKRDKLLGTLNSSELRGLNIQLEKARRKVQKATGEVNMCIFVRHYSNDVGGK